MNKKEEKQSRIALTLLFAGLTFAILLLFIALVAIAVIIFVKTDIISIKPISMWYNHGLNNLISLK